eukprot:CAMPEP_0173299156 /NCGR_PEP_ID=MMETSP1143-20121109/16516_1 /TAXON_ID=483371 /ORGANISM="non described non described, Strain CCMP2298" /LENGTH=41 /DNA_ID= /DNA_START= /DNA_END= /DNA_ORIENTATION=
MSLTLPVGPGVLATARSCVDQLPMALAWIEHVSLCGAELSV